VVNAIVLREELELGARKSASKEHLVRSVEVVVTATPVFDAIRSAAGVFVQKGGLETSVTKVVQTEPTEWNAGLSAHAQTTYHVTLCLENVSVLLAKQE